MTNSREIILPENIEIGMQTEINNFVAKALVLLALAERPRNLMDIFFRTGELRNEVVVRKGDVIADTPDWKSAHDAVIGRTVHVAEATGEIEHLNQHVYRLREAADRS